MTNKINLAKIDKRIHGSLFNDGSFDIFIGLLLFGFGLSILLADLGFGISEELMLYTVIPAFVVYPLLLFFVTFPGRGIMRLTEERRKSKMKLTLVQCVWLVLGLLSGIYFCTQPVQLGLLNDYTVSLAWIAGSIVLCSIAAYSLEAERFYVYGLLAATMFPFRVFVKKIFFDVSTSMFFVASGIMIITDVIVLTRFIRDTPKAGKLDYEQQIKQQDGREDLN
jgi:hypothetical protein